MSNIPFMSDAEQFVIGACLFESLSVGICAERMLRPEHFFKAEHRKAWEAIISLYRNGKVVDFITVGNMGVSDKCIQECQEMCTTTAHLEYYIDILFEYEKYRRAYTSGSDVMAEAALAELPADEVLSKSIDKLLGGVEPTRLSISDCHEMHKEKRERAKKEGIVGFPVQLEPLKQIISSWEAPNNIVIAGKSSNGKTDIMVSELTPQALAGIPVSIYETDMTQDELLERMASNIAKVNLFRFKYPNWTDEEAYAIDEAYDMLKKAPIYICDKSDSTIGDITFFGTLCSIKYGCKLFGMDFLQQIQKSRDERRELHHITVGQWSGKIKSMGKRQGMCTMLLSQVTRYGDKTSDETPPIPNKEILKESGDVENNADIIILVCKEPGRPITEFTFKNKVWNMCANVDKQRNGPTGVINMSFEPRFHQFFTREEGDLRILEYEYADYADK